jgi:hypothetical protein
MAKSQIWNVTYIERTALIFQVRARSAAEAERKVEKARAEGNDPPHDETGMDSEGPFAALADKIYQE